MDIMELKILKISLKRIEIFIPLTDTVPTAVHRMSTGDSQNVHYKLQSFAIAKVANCEGSMSRDVCDFKPCDSFKF